MSNVSPASLTPKQRMLTAFQGGLPDRVPVFPWMFTIIPARIAGIPPRDFNQQFPMWKAQLAAIQYFDCDGWVFAALGEPADPPWRKEETIVASPDGIHEITTVYHTAKGDLRRRRQLPPWDSGAVLEGGVKDFKADIEKLREIIFTDPWRRDVAEIKAMLAGTGQAAACHALIDIDFFAVLAEYRAGGRTQVIYDFYDHQDRLRALRQEFSAHTAEVTRSILERAPVDAIFAGAGDLSILGPDLYIEWCLPAIRAAAQVTSRFKVPLHLHVHGRSMAALDALIEAGVNVIDPFERPPMGDADLQKVKEKYGKKICVCGNVQSIETLLRGTPQEVESEARRCIEAAAGNGAFVLCSADEIALDTPFENIKAMVKAARDYGRYPPPGNFEPQAT